MITSHLLVTSAEYAQYRHKYQDLTHFDMSDSYLSHSLVRGFYNERSELVAGYVVNMKEPYRYLSDLPESVSESIRKRFDLSNVAEVSCMWIDRDIHMRDRFRFYSRCFFDFITSGRKYYLAASTVKEIVDHQMQAAPHLLYDGCFRDSLESMNGKHVWLYYGTAANCVFCFLKYWPKRYLAAWVQYCRAMANDHAG